MWCLVFGVMDNRDKVSKINAELARLELQMELDFSENHDKASLGMKLPKWMGGQGELTVSDVSDDIIAFETSVLSEVSSRLKIFESKVNMDAGKINTTDAAYTSRLVGDPDNYPKTGWRFVYNKKNLILFFWARSKSSSYCVFEDSNPASKFEFDKMSTSTIWEDRAKKASKKYRFVKAHLHADILTASGEWTYV